MNRALKNPSNTIVNVKRALGRRYRDPHVQADFPFVVNVDGMFHFVSITVHIIRSHSLLV